MFVKLSEGGYFVADYSNSLDRRPNEIWLPRKGGQFGAGQGQFGTGQGQFGQGLFGQGVGQTGQGQFGQDQFGPGLLGQGVGQVGQGQFGPGQFGPGLFGQGVGQFGQGVGQFGQGQLGQGQLGQGQFGQGQLGQGLFEQGQLGQGQLGQGQLGQGQFGQVQFGQGQFGQGQFGTGQGQFGQGGFGQVPFGVGQPSFGVGQDFISGFSSINGIETADELLEIVPYDVLRGNGGNTFELRRYPATRWICTQTSNVDPLNDPLNNWQRLFNNNPQAAIASIYFQESPVQKMFRKLQKYFSGVNSAAIEMNQTMPVVVKHVSSRRRSGLEDVEMCMWPGSPWERQELPQPIQGDIYIQTKPQFNVYASRFGGYALSANDFRPALESLRSEISGKNSDRNIYYTATYNNPWTPLRRRNEVWIEIVL